MARDFMLLFWGLIIVFVDITFKGFDLAPDFAGYLLIAFGSHHLAQYARPFLVARNLAWPLAALALLLYASPQNLTHIVLSITAVLTLLLIWSLLAGVIRFTRDRERPDLAGHAVIYRRIFIGIAVVVFLFHQAARVEPEAAAGLVSFATLATLIIVGFILRLLYVVKHELAVDSVIISPHLDVE